jgi:CRP-like cAMP-binding protein
MQTIHEYFSSIVPLSEQESAVLERLVVRKTLRRKQALLSVGERCTFVGFIEEGVMRHFTVDELGNERTCDINAIGNWVTDAKSFASASPSRYTLEALKPCRVALLSQSALDQLYDASPTFQTISRRINEGIVLRLGEISEMLLLSSPEERYKRLMAVNRAVFEQAPRKDIAHLIGIAPESLSRLSKRLYEQSSSQRKP